MGRVGALVGSMSGDRVTPREDPSPHTVVVVDGGKDGARTSVWEPKDPSGAWTDGKTLKERRDTLKWGLKLSLDTESNKDKDEALNTFSTNGLTSANGAPGIKGLGKEVNPQLFISRILSNCIPMSVWSRAIHPLCCP